MNRKILSFPDDQNGPRTSGNNKEGCRYWQEGVRHCALVTEGLFLPMDQHIHAYCRTAHHRSCAQHQQITDHGNRQGDEKTEPVNRRRSIRIPSRHLFRFSEISRPDCPSLYREDDAWTIDISEDGIRLSCRTQLPRQAVILFTIQPAQEAPPCIGTGRVVWCKPLEKTTLFQAGIIFTQKPDRPMLSNRLMKISL